MFVSMGGTWTREHCAIDHLLLKLFSKTTRTTATSCAVVAFVAVVVEHCFSLLLPSLNIHTQFYKRDLSSTDISGSVPLRVHFMMVTFTSAAVSWQGERRKRGLIQPNEVDAQGPTTLCASASGVFDENVFSRNPVRVVEYRAYPTAVIVLPNHNTALKRNRGG